MGCIQHNTQISDPRFKPKQLASVTILNAPHSDFGRVHSWIVLLCSRAEVSNFESQDMTLELAHWPYTYTVYSWLVIVLWLLR